MRRSIEFEKRVFLRSLGNDNEDLDQHRFSVNFPVLAKNHELIFGRIGARLGITLYNDGTLSYTIDVREAHEGTGNISACRLFQRSFA